MLLGSYENYRNFLELLAAQLATALANAQAHEEERRRAEALAELDRAKTVFFSNVSHEFRTPLTLSLAPLEDVLADAAHPLPPEQRRRLELVHRNQLRLLKLVNTLLEFSRIEAGRIDATYDPTDLAAFTTELASGFRSAVEHAGLGFVVACPPLPEPIYVDREMWEKIVLNLLSNALKFTFAGEIVVALRWADDHVELAVRDTGVGIPDAELPRIFERFHRVEGTRARTHEGSGIGLSLVRELAHFHAGTARVQSVEGRGTTITVVIPTGTAHLPSDRLGAARVRATSAAAVTPYVVEALRWLPDRTGSDSLRGAADSPVHTPDSQPRARPARILVADDNADVRDYLARLLGDRYLLELAPDGRTALARIRENPPDLLLTDVMMPELDGFELLRELRKDPRTRTIPVILLSARAGEDARVEGLTTGADDYIIKPFNARELLARIQSHLDLAALRDAVARAARERDLVAAQEDERRRVAQDLHDEIGQILTGLNLTLGLAARLPPPAIAPRLEEAQSLVGDLAARVRRLSFDLRPAMLDDLGLVPALLCHIEHYTAQTGIRVDFRHTGLGRRADPDIENAVFRIAQETLTNIARHAGVPMARLRIRGDGAMLRLAIADRGVGFDPCCVLASPGTRGLAGMQERAVLIGGTLTIEARPGKGTRVVLSAPLRSPRSGGPVGADGSR